MKLRELFPEMLAAAVLVALAIAGSSGRIHLPQLRQPALPPDLPTPATPDDPHRRRRPLWPRPGEAREVGICRFTEEAPCGCSQRS